MNFRIINYKISLILIQLFSSNIYAQNVGIGTSNPDASAMIDITSLTKGLLIPRMTVNPSATATIPPVNGLLIFNTTFNSLNINIGTSAATNILAVPNWSNLWGTSGNFLTSSGNQFLGTTNKSFMHMQTNNIDRLIIDTTTAIPLIPSYGKIGIGLTGSLTSVAIPTSTLQVNGSIATAVFLIVGKTQAQVAYILTALNSLILLNTSTNGSSGNGIINLTLPSASLSAGRVYTIKNIVYGDPTSITPTGSDTIEKVAGANTSYLTALNSYVRLQSDGISNWVVIGKK